MKTAVLYNAKAGKGLPAPAVMGCLSSFFQGDELLVADKDLLCPGLPVTLVDVPEGDTSYFGALFRKVQGLVQAGAERFVSVGGDGTATYVRLALHIMDLNLPMLGVAAGTANVGPIVSLRLEQLEGKHVSQAKEVCYDGLSVLQNGKLVSLAFNDLVIGDTLLATVNGQSCSVSVREMLSTGAVVPKSPCEEMVTPEFVIELNGQALRPDNGKIQQIIISGVAHESHYGRAVYGPIGKCDWSEKKGVIALCDHIAVTFEENDAGTGRISTMQYLLFGPEDQVVLRGFTPDACLICDGNPYLMDGNSIQVKYERDLVRTITL